MQELQSRNDIVITNAEGGTAVILDIGNYFKGAERQLNNNKKLQNSKLRSYYY